MKFIRIWKIFFKTIISLLGIVVFISLIGGSIYYSNLDDSLKELVPFPKLIIQIALGIIVAILASILIILKPIIQVVLTVLQNIIYILTIYLFLQIFFKINPSWVIVTFGIIFVALLTFFFILSWFQRIHSDNQENFKWLNIIKAIIIFLSAPIVLILIMSFVQMLVLLIFDQNIFSISFYEMIENITLKNDSISLTNLEADSITIIFFKIILFFMLFVFFNLIFGNFYLQFDFTFFWIDLIRKCGDYH